MRIQRVRLEHHRDVAILRLEVVDDPVADLQLTAGDRLEAGDHPQRRRLAAARRPDEDEELAVGDVERQDRDGLEAVVIDLVDVAECDGCHRTPSVCSPGKSCIALSLRRTAC